MDRPRIYLDNHATTPLDERVLEAMLPWLREKFGNAASISHSFGEEARAATEDARAQVAELVGARPREVIFTSGATESDNLALKGVLSSTEPGAHLVTAATEHKAVIDTAEALQARGCEVTFLPVGPDGIVDTGELMAAIRPQTALISLMAANNEVGTLNPIEEIGALAEEHGCLFHCDAAQAVGKVPIDVRAAKIDLLSISAHKVYGPKGIGALFVRDGLQNRLRPEMHGGGHERGFRSGTLNVPGCIGLGEASRLAADEMDSEGARIRGYRQLLWESIRGSLPGVRLNGALEKRLPGNLNLSFEGEGLDAEAIMLRMPEIAVSSGSACTSATPAPSHVLRAMGVPDDLAYSSLRFGIGRFNSKQEIEYAADRVIQAVSDARRMLDIDPVRADAGGA